MHSRFDRFSTLRKQPRVTPPNRLRPMAGEYGAIPSTLRRWMSSAAVTTLLLATAMASGAAVVEVCPSGCAQTTIQAGVTAAMPGDVVRVLTTLPVTELDIVVDRDVIIEGLGRGFTTVQAASSAGTAAARIFFITPGVDATIRDMTIRYGVAQTGEGGGIYNNAGDLTLERVDLLSNVASLNGGGIYNAGGSLTLNDATVSYNESRNGSGVYSEAGGALIVDNSKLTYNSGGERGAGIFSSGDAVIHASEISWNSADQFSGSNYQGGGVYNDGTLDISQSTIRSNEITYDNGFDPGGGGIFSSGTLTLSLSVVEYNNSFGFAHGGGILVTGGSAEIVATTIRQNDGSQGGGIAVESIGSMVLRESTVEENTSSGIYVNTDTGTSSVVATTVSGNESLAGAGIKCVGCSLDVINSTVSGNQADWDGGGVYVASAGTVRLANTTVTENSSDVALTDGGDGGGIFVEEGATAILRNSIVAFNHDLSDFLIYTAPDCWGALSSDGYNLVRTLGTSLVGDPPCSMSGGAGDITGQDPLLGPLQDNGGPTLTHSISPLSPAAGSANPSGCFAFDGLPITEDQRGVERLGPCDRGAYEIESPFFADGFESGSTSGWASSVS